MRLRASVLLSIAAVLVGAKALPAPQLAADVTGADLGHLGAKATDTSVATPPAGTSASVATDTAPVQTSTPSLVVVTTSPAVPSTTAVPTTSIAPLTPSTTSTPDTPTLAPTTSPSPVPVTSSSSELNAARVATASTQVTSATASSAPGPTDLPALSTVYSTASDPVTSSTASSTALAQATSSSSSSGGVNTKTILIVGGTVGGVVIAAFIAFSIFRKLKLKPSRSFEERMEPAVSNGHLEEWNDPRTFRGYMQNSSSANSLGRSNSQASSKYSFDAADEKAGGGAGVLRGNTIRQFGAEKQTPMGGDGLREGGRGYRGF